MAFIVGNKKGTRINPRIRDNNPPITVKVIASCPFPFINSLCPGRTLNAVDSSGAPK